ncbi:hypothetical protein [Spirosoma sp.]|uniref:hypothetical protein n=1 Tax=Spirosoma sp. TaxID=1899569 RepID=UPI003B3A4FC3
MTPDKRLDQIEPILADVAQKTDRLIESNGQILEIATRADLNAKIAAKGVADLTVEMRQRFDRVDQRFEQQQSQMDQRFDRVDQRLDHQQLQIDQRFEQQQAQIDNLRQEMQKGFQEVNLKFTQFDQTQQQILTILLDRLK